MRIVSGQCRGRKLALIQGKDIRPTSDRVREAIFNILGPRVRDARVLDLFAGTGAMGLEALSRGAHHGIFVDAAPESCSIIQQNIGRCQMDEKSFLILHDLIRLPLPHALKKSCFDLIFLDPPYAGNYVRTILEKEFFVDLLAPDGIVVVEQSHRESLANEFKGLDIYRQKKYSKTIVSFIRKITSDKETHAQYN